LNLTAVLYLIPFEQHSVGTWGLTGLDRLLCFMIVQELQNFVAYLDRRIMQDKNWLEMFTRLGKELEPVSAVTSKSA
jgi:WASH complex subunit strumpellin